MRRTAAASLSVIALLAGSLTAVAPLAGASTAMTQRPAPAVSQQRLTNLDHLDFLSTTVPLTGTPAHTTYRLSQQPDVGMLWVYANKEDDGSFRRVGGGDYDSTTDTYVQGAFDSDDVARAAVVYLREWRATGSAHARQQAFEQLRGLAYFQTLTGPTAGEMVLWMQPDGTLNPSPTQPDSPNPSDSGASYWMARALWAFGEGYAAFRHSDPAFAAFLAQRMDLGVIALTRDALANYGRYQVIHGVRVPAWLIVDGADASSEAMLGLSAYVTARGSRPAAVALAKLARGVSEMSAGTSTAWPYRALLPWALSRSDWHAWGSEMAAGLSAASTALHRPALLRPAVADTAGFTAQLMTSTGPVNGLLPSPTDRTQIAYGADNRVRSLLVTGVAAHSRGIRDLAGIAAGWFFGANTAGRPTYDPATGVTVDGVESDGRINPNSGAESTIHGLLSMQVLDANPDLAALARSSATISVRDGVSVIEAESGTVTGAATVITPKSAWTGESQWSGSYVAAGDGSVLTWSLPGASQPRLVQPVAELVPASKVRTVISAGRSSGVIRFGAVGAQGNAPSPTELSPVDAGVIAPAAATTVTARTTRGTGNIDALLVMPVVASLIASGNGHGTAVLTSKSSRTELRVVMVAGPGRATVRSYDRNGRLVRSNLSSGGVAGVPVLPGGFSIVTR